MLIDTGEMLETSPYTGMLDEDKLYRFAWSKDPEANHIFFGRVKHGGFWNFAAGSTDPLIGIWSSMSCCWDLEVYSVATVIDPNIIDQLKVIEAKHILKGTAKWLSQRT